MYKLARKVRFSINPFLPQEAEGFNSYASKPPGEGLAIFFELLVEITGEIDKATGFIVNVLDIDEVVRRTVVPVFDQRIRRDFHRHQHISLPDIAGLVEQGTRELAGRFGPAKSIGLSLALNPFAKVRVDSEDGSMVYFNEKFEFAAMHRLWNESFTDSRNLEVFGKCANPAGHGHNYVVEVTVRLPKPPDEFCKAGFEKTVDQEFVKLVDHRNLNTDVPELAGTIPTVENLAAFAWGRLAGKFAPAELHRVTVWETDKTCCSYSGQ
jgi:6-pyruvoyltetrahydropterin/6-carboxytetrahydropterin synthase